MGYKTSAAVSQLQRLNMLSATDVPKTRDISVDDPNTAIDLLDKSLIVDPDAASTLLAKIKELQGPERDAFVSALLQQVDKRLPIWTGSLFSPILARFSRRSRRASLQRVLTWSTPVADDESDQVDSDADLQRRRRRTLIIILQSLARFDASEEEKGYIKSDENPSVKKPKIFSKLRDDPAILFLERAARREVQASRSLLGGKIRNDVSSRLPPGLETPKYTVVERRDLLEIRRYEPFSTCSVAMNQPRTTADRTDAKVANPQLAGASSFGALAGYLFGKNQQQTSMKMTTPVLTQGEGDTRKMSFVLPSNFWHPSGLDNAPMPLEGSGVELERNDGGERAVVMFGGFAAKKEVELRTQQLLDGLRRDGKWQVDPVDSSVSLAQYNDPFTPPWKRLNEVSVKVVSLEHVN